jgi:hypothetical protein
MQKPTMSNSEYLELCKQQNITSPDVLGFLFPNPIPNFIPPSVDELGNIIFAQENDFIASCCFECANYWYFERTVEKVKEDLGYCDHQEVREYTFNGEKITKIRTKEEVAELNRKDEEHVQRNLKHYLCTFPKSDLDSGVLVLFNDQNLEQYDWEWECHICEMVAGY